MLSGLRVCAGLPNLIGMAQDDLEEVEENVRLLIDEELEIQHRLEGHDVGIPACPVCRSHNPAASIGRSNALFT